MPGAIRSVSCLLIAAAVISGCGGDRVTTFMAPEPDPLSGGGDTATRQLRAGQPLGKLAVGGTKSQAVLVAAVLKDGAPMSGVTVELSRSISGRPPSFAWSGTTDAQGEARIEIVSGNVNGYYRARVIQDGSVLGSWSSIPVNGGYQVAAELPVGGKARVIGSSPLSTPAFVGSWAYVGTDMVETISRNLIAAILQEGVVDSATAALIVSEFTVDLETSLRDSVLSPIRRFHSDGTFEDQDSSGAWSDLGTWTLSGNTLTIVESDGLIMESSFEVDGDKFTLTLSREQYMRIVLQAAGELNEEDQEFFDAILREGDTIRFFFEAR